MTIAPADDDERLDRALAHALAAAEPALSRSRIKALILSAQVADAAGRTIADPSRRVKPGQTFAIVLQEPADAGVIGQAMPLDIVYEDSEVIVVDKPAGLVVHPAPGNPDRTLVNALIAHCGASLSGIGGERRPGIVHRLDKDTSGLMIAAKSDAAHAALARQFAAHSVERRYAAVVWGVPRPAAGEITGNIGRSATDRKKMTVRREGGKPARTRYRVMKTLAGGAASLIECVLATGRTHQIRVHLAHLGHPLIGDPVYGRGRMGALPPAARAAAAGFGRQALDSFTLCFDHPRTGERMKFSRELTGDIKTLLSSLEAV